MNHAFHAFLELNKCAVVGHAYDLAARNGPYRIGLADVGPRIGGHLFETERYFFLFFIEVEDFDGYLVTNRNNFGGMFYSAPGHVRYMEQSINAADINESPEIGDVLYIAVEFLADLKTCQQTRFLFASGLLEDLFP